VQEHPGNSSGPSRTGSRHTGAAPASFGRALTCDVVVPDDPVKVVTPIDGVYDQPSTIGDQVRWLSAAGLDTEGVWVRQDLAGIVADAPS
jgi:hypothetical protein